MIKLTDILIDLLTEDRCKRIADRKYDKPSAYKSGAIVRCRDGKIWKDLKEDGLEDTYWINDKKTNRVHTQISGNISNPDGSVFVPGIYIMRILLYIYF